MKRSESFESRNVYKFRNPKVVKLVKACSIIALVILVIYVSFLVLNENSEKSVSLQNIKKAWVSDYDYQKVYEISKQFLEEKSFNNTALIYYGYSCFFLSQAQLENQKVQEYLDECIMSLRMALYKAKKTVLPQIYYILGRAYFSKNSLSTHYYSDLAMKYLLLAKENGYEADDIPEYLGLTYAALGLTNESIAAFTEALLIRESDFLLLSIAEQYFKTSEFGVAKQYLFRVISDSKDDDILLKTKLLLGKIYLEEENFDSALEEFNKVLEKQPNSADAHYGIGVIYENQGNIVKARAEWRKTLRIQMNHAGALQKLSEN